MKENDKRALLEIADALDGEHRFKPQYDSRDEVIQITGKFARSVSEKLREVAKDDIYSVGSFTTETLPEFKVWSSGVISKGMIDDPGGSGGKVAVIDTEKLEMEKVEKGDCVAYDDLVTVSYDDGLGQWVKIKG